MKISRDAHRHLAVASCRYRPMYQEKTAGPIWSIDIGCREEVRWFYCSGPRQFAPRIRRERCGNRNFLRSGRRQERRTGQKKRAATLGRCLLLTRFVAPYRLAAGQFVTD